MLSIFSCAFWPSVSLIWRNVSVQLLSFVWLFATPLIVAHQASLSITNSWSLPKPMSIKSVMPSTYRILCCPLLLRPSIFPSIRLFSNQSVLCIRQPKHWSFSFNISPSNEHPELISLQSKGLSRVFLSTTVQKHQFFSPQPSLRFNSNIIHDYWKNHSFDYTPPLHT